MISSLGLNYKLFWNYHIFGVGQMIIKAAFHGASIINGLWVIFLLDSFLCLVYRAIGYSTFVRYYFISTDLCAQLLAALQFKLEFWGIIPVSAVGLSTGFTCAHYYIALESPMIGVVGVSQFRVRCISLDLWGFWSCFRLYFQGAALIFWLPVFLSRFICEYKNSCLQHMWNTWTNGKWMHKWIFS